ncbi:hypothetical protein KFE25_002842 [Diacronema lutheri]|uniref:Uncharacterized protein n=1 Tax=Diacronema lutheri TaxID=2081491 RepID=A0A8J5XU83_DIALT|nr:hypothetical protein KFE25_002842 [Diacronema lutheri]
MPRRDASTAFEVVCATGTLLAMIVVLAFIPSRLLAIAIAAFWVFVVVVVHLKIWLSGGWRGFAYVVGRFPHAWLFSLSTMHVSICFKLAAVAQQALNPFHSRGQLYKLPGEGLTMRRYARYAMDLDKPLLHRHRKGGYLQPSIYPFFFSPSSVGHLYVVGPYAMLSELSMFPAPTHATLRNDILATEPAYVNFVTLFFNDGNRSFMHVSNLTVLPWTLLYTLACSRFAVELGACIQESEARTSTVETQTFAGRLLHGDYDLPPFELSWQLPPAASMQDVPLGALQQRPVPVSFEQKGATNQQL